MEYKWYTIQVFGNELKVIDNIKNTLELNGLEEFVEDIIVPTKDVIVIKNGEKIIKEESVYSGYVFIKANLTISLQTLLQSVQGVSGFVREGKNPVALTLEDIEKIIYKYKNRGEAKLKYDYQSGDTVLVNEGSFANFKGTVKEYNPMNGILTLEFLILGRKTPFEIHYKYVTKVDEY